MKHVYALIALAFISSAQAQETPKNHTLSVTTEEANVILNKLAEMPWKDANPLLQKLISQLNEQNKPPPPKD
jgi:hypothetical protein